MTFDELERRMKSRADLTTGSGATEGQMLAAEKSLALKFPQDFRLFLTRLGWAKIVYDEIFGLGADVPAHLDIVSTTMAERHSLRPRLPHSLLPVMNDGAGNHYCIQTKVDDFGTYPVVFWNHEQDEEQVPEVVAESFIEWVVARLEDAGR